MQTLEQLYALSTGGGQLLSRVAMAVKKYFFAAAEEGSQSKYWAVVKEVAGNRNWNYWGSLVIDYACSRESVLSELGNAITDEQIEQLVAEYLPKAAELCKEELIPAEMRAQKG